MTANEALVEYKAILPPFCLRSILEQERYEPQNSRTCHALHRRVASMMNTNKDLEQVFYRAEWWVAGKAAAGSQPLR